MIKFNQPYISHRAPELILKALAEEQQGSGPFGKLAEGEIQKLTKSVKSFLTPSCTSALEMATLLLDLQPGDEVLIPSFNFTSGATALVNYGVKPVFVDIDPNNLCIDTKALDSHITNKTKAISWVNYAGMTPNINHINKIATERNLFLIEDNAHSLGTKSEFGYTGTFGDVSTQSYHATKNIQCGEGGSISINKPELIERAEILREKGTNRAQFLAGDVQKYEWADKGSSYLINEISAAYLYANLLDFEEIQKKRQKVWEFYLNSLEDWASRANAEIIGVGMAHSCHIFGLILESQKARDSLLSQLKAKGIQATFHYMPLHSSPMGKKLNTSNLQLPVSDMISSRLIRLPLWPNLDKQDLDNVVSAIVNSKTSN